MAFDFPASPTEGQTYTPAAGVSYVFRNGAWERVAGPFPVMPAGVMSPFAGATAPPGTLLCDGSAVSRAAYPLLFVAIGTAHGAGDGTTTFNVPDMRGRVPFGRDDMGGSAANRLTLAISGIAGATLGAAGGSEKLHTHAHTGSGNTGTISANHSHSGTSDGENVDHVHYVTGGIDVQGAHAHIYDRYSASGANTQTVGTLNQARNPVATWTDTQGAHAHNLAVWSGGRSAGHTHTFTTGLVSANHTHAFSFTADAAGAGASQNVPPAIIANWIIFTGA